MQKAWYDDETKRQLRARFNSHDRLIGKGEYRFPVTAEREYIRLTNWYMKQVKAVLEEELPKLSDQYRQEYADYKAVHQDGLFDFPAFAQEFFDNIREKVEELHLDRAILPLLWKICRSVKNVTVREFGQMIQRTLGLEIAEDYYTDEFFRDLQDEWIRESTESLQKSVDTTLTKMQTHVTEAQERGAPPTEMVTEIQEDYQSGRNYAKVAAAAGIGLLAANMLRKTNEDSGINKYKWQTMEDDRVRDCHQEFNGNIYSYDNPPEAWHYDKTGVKVYEGRFCNPGEDYNCRCQAIPVIEESAFTAPIGGGEGG